MLSLVFMPKLLAQTVFGILKKTIYPSGAVSAPHLRQKASASQTYEICGIKLR